jgi:hypothetical protein
MAKPPKAITEAWLKLTPQQAAFSKAVLDGESKAEAYRLSYNADATPEEARNNGARISKGNAISLYINAEKQWIYEQNAATRAEVVSFLSDSLRVKAQDLLLPSGEINPEHSHLIQQVKTGEAGVESITLIPRLEASRQLAQLQGMNEPEKLQVLSLQALVSTSGNEEEGGW